MKIPLKHFNDPRAPFNGVFSAIFTRTPTHSLPICRGSLCTSLVIPPDSAFCNTTNGPYWAFHSQNNRNTINRKPKKLKK